MAEAFGKYTEARRHAEKWADALCTSGGGVKYILQGNCPGSEP